MTFDSDLDFLTARIEELAQDNLDEYGQQIQDEIVESISTPYPPASAIGEHPHKRTGALAAGISHITAAEGELLITEIISQRDPQKPGDTRSVPGVLNFVFYRPYMSDFYQDMQTRFAEESIPRLIERINSR